MYWNQFCYIFFQFWEILSQLGFPFTQLNRANTQNLEIINFDMFYKMIAEQSSVIQYAWPMYHMKEK